MSQQHILQVSELTKKVRFILESELNTVWLTGEISNFVAASSGHWYLSLKDARSQVRCAMFKGNNRRVRIKPKNGQQVLVKAKVSLYEPRGDFQLIIEQMDDAGEGLLRQQFEQLKNQLNREGLFDLSYKKIIPEHIATLGVVTSPTGAAVKDILTVLKRRNPNIKVIIYPTQVQGNTAATEISKAIEIANKRAECQALIVGRGGGSLEDLWCFNEEAVVRAIFASELPIVSAVGHEIDTTLADYVADLRAPTPSAAAELVSKDQSSVLKTLAALTERLFTQQNQQLVRQQQFITHLSHRLSQVHPEQQLQMQQQRSDDLSARLLRAQQLYVAKRENLPAVLHQRLLANSPEHILNGENERINNLHRRMQQAQQHLYQQSVDKFSHLAQQLHTVSPLATIARGYSAVKNSEQKIIRSTKQVKKGDVLTVQVSDGEFNAQVVD
ncbi:exodeoxyribonuclease VII large subunit [Endozoicomonas sp. G2_1]|uniref:exodeoxyribonuclease VII large subunit n=1 Tax=Endozoicomonas sp. G2_1 TaxID=2821091 RepID=UPI001ADB6137|nr:exodeoxyribonuclease VII large subunit [Endozoicomonas sp. G2_1]MBO9489454.1 exodeoxyribonuclease VII large subunit [Endozoicomonas sp. G2_1]